MYKNEAVGLHEVSLGEASHFVGIIAKEGGARLKERFLKRDYRSREKEGVDFTTEADVEVDKLLVDRISSEYPGHQFLTEETAPEDYSGLEKVEWLWVIDPLDGTANFSRGKENFAISIALMNKGKVVLGAVYVPMRDEFFTARADSDGAFLNGEPIKVSDTRDLRVASVGMDWAWDLEKRKNVHNWLGKVMGEIRQPQSLGSAVADLCRVAQGQSDTYFHSGIKPWDVAAAGFIVQKAGGKVTDIDGSEWTPFKSEILATNGVLHEPIVELIAA